MFREAAQQEQERVRETPTRQPASPITAKRRPPRQLNEIERRLGAAGGSAALAVCAKFSMQASPPN